MRLALKSFVSLAALLFATVGGAYAQQTPGPQSSVPQTSVPQSKLPVPSPATAAPRETPQQRLERLREEKPAELPAELGKERTAQVGGNPPGEVPAVKPDTDKSLLAADPKDAPLPGLKRLSPDAKVWIDPVGKRVVLEGEIVLRRGPLELLACLKQTKEHEAIIAVDTQAYVVHAALLAIGATPGNPARFTPEFTPARGTEITITVEWKDAAGKTKSIDAREWLLNVKTGKQLAYPWVFGGSGFWTDPMTGKNFYQAEDGDFICVSNFPTAMLDLPVESPQANAALMFEAFTERIPDEKTKIVMILTPKLAKAGDAKAGEAKPAATPRAGETGKAESRAPAAASSAPAPATPAAATPATVTTTEPAPAPRPVTTQAPARGPIRRIFRRP